MKAESEEEREAGRESGRQSASSPSPALTEDRLTRSQRLQELLLFAVLELAQAQRDKESRSTEEMKTCRELPLAHVSKVGARVNSSEGRRRETRCEGSRRSAEVSRGQREAGGCRGDLEERNSRKMLWLRLAQHRLQTTQDQNDSAAKLSCKATNQLTALIT